MSWHNLKLPYAITHEAATRSPRDDEHWSLDASSAGRGMTRHATLALAQARAAEIFGPPPSVVFTIKLLLDGQEEIRVEASDGVVPDEALKAAIGALEAERRMLSGCPVHTSSPDASPDSGEAERAALLRDAFSNPPAVKIGEGEYDYAKIEQLPRMLRDAAADILFFDCEPHVTIDAWNIARMAADELEACLAASPASLSGGAGVPWHTDLGGLLEAQRVIRQAYKAIETAKAQNTHIPGNPYDVALSSLNPALASLDTLIVSHPSPEAPANRQEAGE